MKTAVATIDKIDDMTWPKDAPKPQAILFCCTMNAIRSPMAEGLLKRFCGTSVYVDSVGVEDAPADNFMIEAMADIGIDMSRHGCKLFSDLHDSSYDLIVALSPEAYRWAARMAGDIACEIWHWQVSDPSEVEGNREARKDAYVAVRDDICRHVERLIEVCGLARVD